MMHHVIRSFHFDETYFSHFNLYAYFINFPFRKPDFPESVSIFSKTPSVMKLASNNFKWCNHRVTINATNLSKTNLQNSRSPKWL